LAQTTTLPAWLRALLNRRMLICIFTGFASGLPLYLLLNLVPAWLKTEGVSLTVIGVFALAQIPFTWKFLWAPLLDRYNIVSWLGRRRGWMFVSQIGLLAAIAWLGQIPLVNQQLPFASFFRDVFDITILAFPWQAFVLATVVALLSATQDIALDAFRREILPDEELGLGNAIHMNAYRIASLIPGSLALILADRLPWGWVFAVTAVFMLPGLCMTLLVSEPAVAKGAPRTLRAAVVEPFHEFFSRHGVQSALLVLVFVFLYKLGDSLCTALATPFYLDVGYSMTEIGLVAKNAGLWSSVAGGILGGIWMLKLGINRALWVFGVVQAVVILGFAWLAWQGPPYFKPVDRAGMPPDALVQAAIGEVSGRVLANRAILDDEPRNARTLTDNILRQHFDFNQVARLVLGPEWEWEKGIAGKRIRKENTVTEEQEKRLADALHSMFLHRYSATVIEYAGAVSIEPLSPDAHGDTMTVNARLQRDGMPPAVIGFSLKKTGQNWKIFDVALDGKSLAQTYRARLADAARMHGVDGLIEWLGEEVPTDIWALVALALVVGLEALGVGLGSAAFFAFMARTTHPAYTATQLALFTSLMAMPRTFINASAGWLVENMGGWLNFFWLCFFLAIPGMLLLFKVAPWNGEAGSVEKQADSALSLRKD
jgi:PAT family beta-lactamase induction signal transducer AmpG